MLHALKLAFTHPKTGKRMEFRAPLPGDFQQGLKILRGEGIKRSGSVKP
jgi:hypothetical protein